MSQDFGVVFVFQALYCKELCCNSMMLYAFLRMIKETEKNSSLEVTHLIALLQ